MQHTFGLIVPGSVVTSLSDSSATVVRLCGSISELGAWSVDKGPQLSLQTKNFFPSIRLLNEPRFYRVDVRLSEEIQEFEYRYVINNQIWEGIDNKPRKWMRDNAKYLADDVYYTPIDYWIDAKSDNSNEQSHTTRFYNELVGQKLMHYGRVNDQLYVGSCPRLASHISNDLRGELGITAVINLQVLNDIERNCLDIFDKDLHKNNQEDFGLNLVENLRKIYEKENILLIWLPTTDFSSLGRELMFPQATLVLKTMLDKGHRIYVHCNAGVGRAFGLICSYYHFVLKKPLASAQYELAPIRSCGYFDWRFLENARKVYEKAFE